MRPLLVIFLLVLCSCQAYPISMVALPISTEIPVMTITPTVNVATPTPPSTATAEPTGTPSPTPTFTRVLTATPTQTATKTVPVIEPKEITAPILLYHRLSQGAPTNIYTVTAAIFRAQMNALRQQGYKTILASQLIEAMQGKIKLPEKTALITFDDGYRSVFELAFPILKEMGFTATLYLISGAIGQNEYVTENQVRQLLAAGWEVGSHTQTHPDLRKNYSLLDKEVSGSKTAIQAKVGNPPVITFAYPYGVKDATVLQKVKDAGYAGAMGLGLSTRHKLEDVFFMTRIDMRSADTLESFRRKIKGK